MMVSWEGHFIVHFYIHRWCLHLHAIKFVVLLHFIDILNSSTVNHSFKRRLWKTRAKSTPKKSQISTNYHSNYDLRMLYFEVCRKSWLWKIGLNNYLTSFGRWRKPTHCVWSMEDMISLQMNFTWKKRIISRWKPIISLRSGISQGAFSIS